MELNFALCLGILAGMIQVASFIIYIRGSSKPNTATWTILAFLTVLNAFSYKVMTDDWIKSIPAVASSITTVGTFLFCLLKGKFSKIDSWDKVTLVIGMISVFVWWRYHSAVYANIILQISTAISFFPTYKGVWKDPVIEKAFPWILLCSIHVLGISIIFLRWTEQLEDLVYSGSLFLLDLIVVLLTRRKIVNQKTPSG